MKGSVHKNDAPISDKSKHPSMIPLSIRAAGADSRFSSGLSVPMTRIHVVRVHDRAGGEEGAELNKVNLRNKVNLNLNFPCSASSTETKERRQTAEAAQLRREAS